MEPCGSDPFGARVKPRIGSKKMQIGNEANFVCKRGLSTFLYFSSWLRGILTDVQYVFIPNWIQLDPLPCAGVHAGKILDQIQQRTEPYRSALVCTGP